VRASTEPSSRETLAGRPGRPGRGGAVGRVLCCAFGLLLSLAGCSSGDVRNAPPRPARVPSDLAVDSIWYLQPQFTPAPEYRQPPPLPFDGRLYYAERPDRVVAFDAGSGRRAWGAELKPLPGASQKGVQVSTGFAAGAGLLLVGTRQGRLIALDLASGAQRWEAQLSSEVSAPPLIQDKVVLARSNDGKVYALDAADGRQRWVYSSVMPALSLRGSSRPVAGAGQVYVGLSNGKLVALSLESGEAAWEATVGVAEGRSEFERLVDINADPALADDTVYAAAYQARLVAVATANGRIQWSRELSTYQSLLLDGDRIYVVADKGSILAVNRGNGAVLWRQDGLAGRSLTAPVLSEGTILVGDEQGYLHWLSPEDGSFVARRQVAAGAILSAPAVAGDTLYLADSSGALQALRVSPHGGASASLPIPATRGPG
jgi:outer membrane protein assembly factor BamB